MSPFEKSESKARETVRCFRFFVGQNTNYSRARLFHIKEAYVIIDKEFMNKEEQFKWH